MTDDDFLLELYADVRQALKRVVNEEENYDNVKFWGTDIIERVQHMCRLKKRIIKRKEQENENKSICN